MDRDELIEKMARAVAISLYEDLGGYAKAVNWPTFEEYWNDHGQHCIEVQSAALDAILKDHAIVPREGVSELNRLVFQEKMSRTVCLREIGLTMETYFREAMIEAGEVKYDPHPRS